MSDSELNVHLALSTAIRQEWDGRKRSLKSCPRIERFTVSRRPTARSHNSKEERKRRGKMIPIAFFTVVLLIYTTKYSRIYCYRFPINLFPASHKDASTFLRFPRPYTLPYLSSGRQLLEGRPNILVGRPKENPIYRKEKATPCFHASMLPRFTDNIGITRYLPGWPTTYLYTYVKEIRSPSRLRVINTSREYSFLPSI